MPQIPFSAAFPVRGNQVKDLSDAVTVNRDLLFDMPLPCR